MRPRLEHIGIAAADPAAVERVYRDLFGHLPYRTETVEREGVRTRFFSAGSAKLEVLDALNPDSPVARFLERRGEGLHHLAFEVEDAEAEWRRLKGLGYAPLGDGPAPGADGKTIFFLHPRQTHGVLVEFCQSTSRPLARRLLTLDSHEGSVHLAGPEDAPLALLVTEPSDDPAHGTLDFAYVLQESFRVLTPAADRASPMGADVLLRHLPALLRKTRADRLIVAGLGRACRRIIEDVERIDEHATELVLLFPQRFPPVPYAEPASTVLIIGGSRRLETAMAWHRAISGSRFLAIPHASLDEADAATHRWIADQIRRRARDPM